eukprot:TRINITY_DN3253_c0_g1_i2.p1 TRINITY_DN3253_c0_g1~~TRINITY_DN3253_c0_g1_i2.p1  ORF type:complete len:583 (+),score=134.01 TRINITY_DN3253_c0_g1_i2:1289-3037(+)
MDDVLWEYYKGCRFVDCEIVDGADAERKWGCHRVVLAANSSYFDALFAPEQVVQEAQDTQGSVIGTLSQAIVRLPFPQQATHVFGDIVSYLYNQSVQNDIPLEDTVPLLVLAALLGMDGLSVKLYNALMQLSSSPTECVAVLSLLTDQWLKDLDSVVCKAALSASINHQAMAVAVRGAREAAVRCKALHKHCVGTLVPSLTDLCLEELPPESLLSILQHSTQDAATTSSLVSKYIIKKEASSVPDNVFSQLCLHVTNIPAVDLTSILKVAIERKEGTLIKKCLSAASDAYDKVDGLDNELLNVLDSGGLKRKRSPDSSEKESKDSSHVAIPPNKERESQGASDTSQTSSAPLVSSSPDKLPQLTGGSDVLFGGTLQEKGFEEEDEEEKEKEAIDAVLTMSQSQDCAGVQKVMERLHTAMASHRKKRKVICKNTIIETKTEVYHKVEHVRKHCSELWSGVEDTLGAMMDELANMTAAVKKDVEGKTVVLEELRQKCDGLEEEVLTSKQQCAFVDDFLQKIRMHTSSQIQAAGHCSKQLVTTLKEDADSAVSELEKKLNNVADKNTGALKRLSALLASELSMDT